MFKLNLHFIWEMIINMVIQVNKVKEKKRNYFMTDEEAKILWQYSKKWSSKFQIILGFALFRGMRIGEIMAINLYDFQNESFQKLNIILEKSHIADNFPLLNDFNKLLKKYVLKNKHLFKDGYLFPYYSSKKHSPYMSVKVAEALFSKFRKIVGKNHPQFLDKVIVNKNYHRYRIGWHSCRRWFETRIWDKYKDKMLTRDIMRYSHSKVVDVYINPYEVWKNEMQILENTFGSLFQEFNRVSKGQMKLDRFI